MDEAMDKAYPKKTRKIKSTDDPSITPAIKQKIRQRKRAYKKNERSTRWRELKAESRTMIRNSKKEHYERFTKLAREMGDSSLCLLYTSPSPRDRQKSRMPSSA